MPEIAVNTKTEGTKAPPVASSPSIASEIANGSGDFEFPLLFRGLTDTAQVMENWRIMKDGVEKLTILVEGSCSTAAKESADCGLKLIDTTRSNSVAALELARGLTAAKSPSEVVELSSAHARRLLDIIFEQNQQLWALAQRLSSTMMETTSSALTSRPKSKN